MVLLYITPFSFQGISKESSLSNFNYLYHPRDYSSGTELIQKDNTVQNYHFYYHEHVKHCINNIIYMAYISKIYNS